jgi:hypothetical protein
MENYENLSAAIVDMVSILEEHLDYDTYKKFDNLGSDIIKKLIKLEEVENILREKNGISDNQEFGLNYSQAINYLNDIETILKK